MEEGAEEPGRPSRWHLLSDEGFVHINAVNGTLTVESIKQEIERLKAEYEQFEKDKEELEKKRSEAEKCANHLNTRSSKLIKRLTDEKQTNTEMECSWQSSVSQAREESDTLTEKQRELERELEEEERKKAILDEEVKMSSARPERKVVFKGILSDGQSKECGIDIKPRILYPMSGGTALITFEKAEVAQKVIEMKEHKVSIEECFIRVQAMPVELPMPSSINMDMNVCNLRILVSNIPDCIPQDRVLDKLELFFTKKKNGGGEVDHCEFLPDSGHVVIAFAEEGVAKHLTAKGLINLPVENRNYQVKVTPYVKGEIKDLQFRDSICLKTVQLTGIPDIMDEEALQDVLEIHFQKKGNGGGEVDVVHYVPLGRRAIAVFEEDAE